VTVQETEITCPALDAGGTLDIERSVSLGEEVTVVVTAVSVATTPLNKVRSEAPSAQGILVGSPSMYSSEPPLPRLYVVPDRTTLEPAESVFDPSSISGKIAT
jgi:hypothetical protein